METTGSKQKRIMRGWNERNIAYWTKLRHNVLLETNGYLTMQSMAESEAKIIALRQEIEKLTKRIIKLEKKVQK